MGLNPCDVEKLIEGEPYISTIPVEPGFTNSVQIKGMNSENKVRNEGVNPGSTGIVIFYFMCVHQMDYQR